MRYYLSVWLVIGSFAMAFAQETRSIQGRISRGRVSKMYLVEIDPIRGTTRLVDSSRVSRKHFTFRTTQKEPGQFWLTAGKTTTKLPFIWDADLVVRYDRRDSTRNGVENSPATADWKAFVQSIDPAFEQAVREHQQRSAEYAEREQQRQPKHKLYEELPGTEPNRVRMDTTRFSVLHGEFHKLQAGRHQQVQSFIEAHPQSWFNLFLLCWYRKELFRTHSYKVARQLPTELRQSELYRQLDRALQEL